jgi:hypothetical protein
MICEYSQESTTNKESESQADIRLFLPTSLCPQSYWCCFGLEKKPMADPDGETKHVVPAEEKIVSPFDAIFLPEIWLQIRTYAGGRSSRFTEDDVTRAMIAFTCRAELAIMRREMRYDEYDPDTETTTVHERDWQEPIVLFWHAAAHNYGSVCKWIWHEWPDKRDLFYMDDALFYGHWALAEELDDLGAGIRESAMSHLVLNNKFEAMKWLVAHGYVLDKGLLSSARCDRHLPLVRWLAEEHGQDMKKYACLEDTLKNRSFELAAYLVDHGATLERIFVYFQIASGGAWEVLDFLKARFPEQYEEACKQCPLLPVRHTARPDVLWRQYVNLSDPNAPAVKTEPWDE